jgi:hypothetical protein
MQHPPLRSSHIILQSKSDWHDDGSELESLCSTATSSPFVLHQINYNRYEKLYKDEKHDYTILITKLNLFVKKIFKKKTQLVLKKLENMLNTIETLRKK